jgi:hypothetical protein
VIKTTCVLILRSFVGPPETDGVSLEQSCLFHGVGRRHRKGYGLFQRSAKLHRLTALEILRASSTAALAPRRTASRAAASILGFAFWWRPDGGDAGGSREIPLPTAL